MAHTQVHCISFFNFFLVGGWLLYNIILVSTIHQHEISHRYTYVFSLLNLPPTTTPLKSTGLNSLHHTANTHWLFISCVLNLVRGNMNLPLKYDLIAFLCLPMPNDTWLDFVYKASNNFLGVETSDK